MSDEEGIRKTLAEFCQFLDDRRFKEWSELFAPDGAFGQRSGRDAIFANISEGELARRPELKRKHTVSNLIIDIDGDRAHVVSDLVMFDEIAEATWSARVGKYEDDMVRLGERWLFERRQLRWI